MRRLIGIGGMAGSGKDTVANTLISDYGYARISFAEAVKDVVAAIFGWDRRLLEGDTSESRAWREVEDQWWTERLDMGVAITPRYVLQNIGTEVFRKHFHPDIWIAVVERKLRDSVKPVVITDGRFLNELQMIKEKGGLVCGIYRALPKWLDEFYTSIDQRIRMHSAWEGKSGGLMEIDFSKSNHRTVVAQFGEEQIKAMRLTVHQSEWEHLLYNDYEVMIPNLGNLKDLHAKVIELVSL